MVPKRWVVYLALCFAMIFWSLSFVWYKMVYVYYLPFTTISLRFVLSSVLLLFIGRITGYLQNIRRADWKFLILQAFLNPFLYFIWESQGLLYVSSNISAVIISTIPLFTPIAALYFYREKLSAMNVAGMLVSFFGIILTVLQKDLGFSVPVKGLLFLGLAVLTAVAYIMVLKNMAMKYNAFSVIAWQNTVGTLMFLPLFFIFEGKQFLSTGWVWKAMIPVIELAVFASSAAYILNTFGVRNIGAAKASFFSNIIPVFTGIFAYFLLGETLTIHQIMGMALVMLGLFLSQWKGAKEMVNSGRPRVNVSGNTGNKDM
jgi:drug/metabolite transporter (DMT)-like permease